jgi:hypothetical protein
MYINLPCKYSLWRPPLFVLRFLWLFLLILFSLSSAAADQSLPFSFSFDAPHIESRGDHHLVTLPGSPSQGNPGEPLLPIQTIYVLLPPGQKISHIAVNTGPSVSLAGQYHLVWGQQQRPLSAPPGDALTPPNPTIYSSSDPYPKEVHRLVGVWPLRGYRVAVINLYPVRYIPAEGILSYSPHMAVQVHTVPSADILMKTREMFRSSEKLIRRLQDLVENPEILETYGAIDQSRDGNKPDEPQYPYLIITDESLVSAFQPLADWKTECGLRTKLITTQDIAAGYSGTDLPEQIRNCILDAYTAWQTDCVLLGGDDELVPHRGLFDEAFGYTDDDIPSDLYYGALDGNWNADGDELWGEPGEEDLLVEVNVGRAPVDDVTEAQHFVDKVIRYEKMPVSEQTVEALMAAEELFDNPQTWGGDYKDEVKDGSDNHGYTTQGLASHFNVNTLYDRDLGYSWWGGILLNRMNEGLHLINHVGHTSVSRALRLSADQVLNDLTNDGVDNSYFIIYSQGCYAASFDNRNPGGAYLDDCVAEAFVSGEHGAVAFVGNSRYGWAESGTTNGASQYFDRQFFDALFGEEITTLGAMNDDSKADNLWALDYPGIRWCYYEQNLLGDPSLSIWTDVPESLTVVHPEVVTIDEHNTFLVVVFADSVRIPDALVCISGQDGLYITEHTNGGGIAYMAVDPIIPDTLNICVTAHNRLPYHGTILARADHPWLAYSQHSIDDDKIGDSWGNNNGVVNQGEIFELTIWLQNFGGQTAQEVSAELTTADPYVTILDSIKNYPDIAPEEQAAGQEPFVVSVNSECPDGRQIVFAVEAWAEEAAAETSSFSLQVSAPHLMFENVVLNDDPPQGNGNGILEPNESALLMITIRNTGSQKVSMVTGELSAGEDPYLQVQRDEAFFSALESGSASSGWPAYKIYASPESPAEYLFDYAVHLTAGDDYSTADSFPGALGPTGLVDDMEDPTTTWKAGDLWHLTDQESHSLTSSWHAGWDSLDEYPKNVDASLTSQNITLLSGSTLDFWHRYDLEDGEDFGYVEMYDDTNWTYLNASYTGSSDGWVRESFDLSGWPNGAVIKIRFRLISDEQICGEGWFIDDVSVGPPKRFLLDQAQVKPDRGGDSTEFTFSINYISDRNYPPTLARVYIDGTPRPLTSSDDDFRDGAIFSYQTTLDPGEHEYHFWLESGLEKIRWPRFDEYLGPLVVEDIYQEDFENDDGGYTVTGPDWEWGIPTSGPGQAHSGQKIWATVLAGKYSNGADARLETPPIDLAGILEPQLSFWHWYYFEPRPARYDGANVKISIDGGDFEVITPQEGYDGVIHHINAGIPDEPGFCLDQGQYWHQEIFDLAPYSGHQVTFRFHFGSDGSYVYPGWYIDDVSVTGLESTTPPPEMVTNLQTEPRQQDVHLSWSWTGETAPWEYAVYRGLLSDEPLSEPQLVAIVTDTTYVDMAAAGDTTRNYYYQVRAIGADGQQSDFSKKVGEFDIRMMNSHSR